jgi:hypothetical protein
VADEGRVVLSATGVADEGRRGSIDGGVGITCRIGGGGRRFASLPPSSLEIIPEGLDDRLNLPKSSDGDRLNLPKSSDGRRLRVRRNHSVVEGEQRAHVRCEGRESM